jgi:cytochrome c oxidase subunit 1
MTGRMLNETWGKISFWILFIGFNLTFFPMHILGLYGMTRRIYTYPSDLGWAQSNLLATIGAFVIAVGGGVFIANVLSRHKEGEVAGDNPWDAGTLEWAVASPPRDYNFAYLPVAEGRHPLWIPPDNRTLVTGMRKDRREILVTTLMDAAPHHRYVLPGPTVWPFLTALGAGIGLSGSVFQFGWYFVAAGLAGLGLVGWFWPRRSAELIP